MRLITRADFDGLVCATILKEIGIINTWKFVHPKDLQDGIIEITDRDVLANVPYVPGCSLWFDHHSSEEERLGLGTNFTFEGASYAAPSAARIVYDYYGGAKVMPHFEDMITAVDRVDSGLLTQDEIIEPKGWVLLGFIMDPRTGLGRFSDFTINNFEFMEQLIDHCRTKKLDEILELPDVKERIVKYEQQSEKFKDMILEHSKINWEVLVTDLRGVKPIYTGNRFLIYSLFPEQSISCWVTDGKNKENVAIAVGHSILNRSARVDVGNLMLKYGGGGHYRVGTCQVPYDKADMILIEIVEAIKSANAREAMPDDEMSYLMDEIDDLLAGIDDL